MKSYSEPEETIRQLFYDLTFEKNAQEKFYAHWSYWHVVNCLSANGGKEWNEGKA
jgi:hypothetical protein